MLTVDNQKYLLTLANVYQADAIQAIERAQREVKEAVKLFGGKESDYTSWFHIVDDKFKYHRELDNAI